MARLSMLEGFLWNAAKDAMARAAVHGATPADLLTAAHVAWLRLIGDHEDSAEAEVCLAAGASFHFRAYAKPEIA